jgi:hypothetical protein
MALSQVSVAEIAVGREVVMKMVSLMIGKDLRNHYERDDCEINEKTKLEIE